MIRIICVGKIKESYLNNMIEDYLKRISRYHKVEIIELKDSDIEEESKLILKTINKDNYTILLDINGEIVTSLDIANIIDEVFTSGYGTIEMIIGGSLGVNSLVKNQVKQMISLGKVTYPHGLFRGILLEQIYRSFKILNNETYHK